ncbi:uncharacterized protein MYCFIDRAFT_180277 [Pseudocercospora fijiensis CIRAD86]|uniref:Uncharacterized protein n=1 Tax=Pseudocercospora fijiensis (strain CIRAD86) TaxID=383855 RepID=M2ZYC8_PSEFD|nr:uncharacterized protein MYCFIDRAFT_180277 [Pseudocercospora fijiensis CIRAD86]EME77121.1 hypothetical protein MYCFIDRAFT_180277 [Pseudocercospora fijiensis CIRAD86]
MHRKWTTITERQEKRLIIMTMPLCLLGLPLRSMKSSSSVEIIKQHNYQSSRITSIKQDQQGHTHQSGRITTIEQDHNLQALIIMKLVSNDPTKIDPETPAAARHDRGITNLANRRCHDTVSSPAALGGFPIDNLKRLLLTLYTCVCRPPLYEACTNLAHTTLPDWIEGKVYKALQIFMLPAQCSLCRESIPAARLECSIRKNVQQILPRPVIKRSRLAISMTPKNCRIGPNASSHITLHLMRVRGPVPTHKGERWTQKFQLASPFARLGKYHPETFHPPSRPSRLWSARRARGVGVNYVKDEKMALEVLLVEMVGDRKASELCAYIIDRCHEILTTLVVHECRVSNSPFLAQERSAVFRQQGNLYGHGRCSLLSKAHACTHTANPAVMGDVFRRRLHTCIGPRNLPVGESRAMNLSVHRPLDSSNASQLGSVVDSPPLITSRKKITAFRSQDHRWLPCKLGTCGLTALWMTFSIQHIGISFLLWWPSHGDLRTEHDFHTGKATKKSRPGNLLFSATHSGLLANICQIVHQLLYCQGLAVLIANACLCESIIWAPIRGLSHEDDSHAYFVARCSHPCPRIRVLTWLVLMNQYRAIPGLESLPRKTFPFDGNSQTIAVCSQLFPIRCEALKLWNCKRQNDDSIAVFSVIPSNRGGFEAQFVLISLYFRSKSN